MVRLQPPVAFHCATCYVVLLKFRALTVIFVVDVNEGSADGLFVMVPTAAVYVRTIFVSMP